MERFCEPRLAEVHLSSFVRVSKKIVFIPRKGKCSKSLDNRFVYQFLQWFSVKFIKPGH